MSVLSGLPAAAFAIAPELRLLEGRSEPRAACTACPVSVPPEQLDDHPEHFRADARCCTYHPELLSWQLGRALRDPDSAALVSARLARGDAVSAKSIAAPPGTWVSRERFGRDLADRCPYWQGGALACGIWRHRTGVCRTWFCLVDDATRSLDVWGEARRLIRAVSRALARHCDEAGAPPADDAGAEALAAWYIRCAERVEALTDAQAAALRDEAVAHAASRLEAALGAVGMPVPDIVTASVKDIAHRPDGCIRLVGYRRQDPVVVPGLIFRFIGRLDGQTPWRDALAAARDDGLVLSDAAVEHLFRRGVLQPARSPDMTPGAQLVINDQVVRSDY